MDAAIRVRTIDQDTFDEVVRENVQEFDMELNEAIEDAADQFKSQEVELSNIVKTMSLNDNGEPYHPVVAAVTKLKSVHNAATVDGIVSHADELDIIRNECARDISYRILAAKNNAYPVLMSCCQSLVNAEVSMIVKCLATLVSLSNGQPDLLVADDIPFILELLSSYENQPDVITIVLKFLRHACIKHESNRQLLIGSRVVAPVLKIVDICNAPSVVRECCALLRAFTLDDDIRVPFGKAYDHAKLIASDHSAIKLLSNLISKFEGNPDIVAELLATLSKLAVRNEFCQEIMERDGLKFALSALVIHVKHQTLVKNALILVKTTAGNDDVRKAIIDCGGAPSILNAMQSYMGQSPQVIEAGCVAIAMLAMRNPVNCINLMEAGAANVLIQAMKLHPGNEHVLKQSCMAIRNLISSTKQFIPDFIDQDVETLINRARVEHKIEDEAKAALRDLGCKVELKELWKGVQGHIGR